MVFFLPRQIESFYNLEPVFIDVEAPGWAVARQFDPTLKRFFSGTRQFLKVQIVSTES